MLHLLTLFDPLKRNKVEITYYHMLAKCKTEKETWRQGTVIRVWIRKGIIVMRRRSNPGSMPALARKQREIRLVD